MAGSSRQRGSGSSSQHQQEDDIVQEEQLAPGGKPKYYLSQRQGGLWWEDKEIAEVLGRSFTGTYGEFVTNWSDASQEQRDAMFNYFQQYVRCDPEYDLRAGFEKHIKRRITYKINKASKAKKRPTWMPLGCFEMLMKRNDDPKWKAKAEKAAANRKTGGKDGKAPPTSTLGQQSAARAFKKMVGDNKGPHDVMTVSKKNKKGEWICEKAEILDADYHRIKNQYEESGSSKSEYDMYLEAVGGFDKKNRIFGLGSAADQLYVPPSVPRRHSESSYTPSVVAQYATKNAQLEAELNNLRAQQARQETETQMLKSMMAAQFGWTFDETCAPGPTPQRRDDHPDDGHGFGSQSVQQLGCP